MNEKPRKKVVFTAEQRAQHQAIRDVFREWHPGPEELIASGAAARLGLNVLYSPARKFLAELKRAREAAGLTLAKVATRCGIDQPALSRLENGRTLNPTLETLWKYAAALGKRLVLSAENVEVSAKVQPSHTPRSQATAGRRGRQRKAPADKK